MSRAIERVLAAMAAAWMLAAPHAWAQTQLRYLGYQALADTSFDGVRIGGLSGIDYDPVSGTYYAISDDRIGQARHYTLRIDPSKFARDGSGEGVRVTGAYRLRDLDGRGFASRRVDAEAIRVDHRRARLYWTSEGNPGIGVPPSVREMTLAGEPVRALPLPARYLPRPGRGVRGNLAFESLTLSADGSQVIAATESALRQDGEPATAIEGSPCRVLMWDRASGRVSREHVYMIDPVAKPPLLPGGVAMNGLSELLAIDASRMIAVERSYAVGAGFTIRLYLTGFAGASDVKDLDALAGATYTPMRKALLLDLAASMPDPLAAQGASPPAPPIDNYEGIAFGAPLPNGNRTLVLVSDDNFSGMQRTLFLAFEVLDDARDGGAGAAQVQVRDPRPNPTTAPGKANPPALQ